MPINNKIDFHVGADCKTSYFEYSWGYNDRTKHTSTSTRMPKVEKVIFNPPATIVVWNDGTKTIVKAKEKGRKKDKYSKEYGLAMAIAKRYFGNRSRFLKAVEDGKSYD